eukprot:3643956-Ditylum_brightwellii.AAC.1
MMPSEEITQPNPENEETLDDRYGPRRREGLRPRRRRDDVPQKFRDHAHTMLQVGEHFDKYETAHREVHHQNSNSKKQIMDEP